MENLTIILFVCIAIPLIPIVFSAIFSLIIVASVFHAIFNLLVQSDFKYVAFVWALLLFVPVVIGVIYSGKKKKELIPD